jgi:hypothetical protein
MAGFNPSPRQALLETSRQFVRGKMLCAAVRLSIADALGDSEKSLDELAAITKSDRDGLYRFLRAMAGIGPPASPRRAGIGLGVDDFLAAFAGRFVGFFGRLRACGKQQRR